MSHPATLDAHGAAVEFDQLPDDGKAKTKAAVPARGRRIRLVLVTAYRDERLRSSAAALALRFTAPPWLDHVRSRTRRA